MTIQKAIEILQLNLFAAGKKMPPDVKDALTLAIKALVKCQQYHPEIISDPPPPLLK